MPSALIWVDSQPSQTQFFWEAEVGLVLEIFSQSASDAKFFWIEKERDVEAAAVADVLKIVFYRRSAHEIVRELFKEKEFELYRLEGQDKILDAWFDGTAFRDKTYRELFSDEYLKIDY